MNKIATIAFAAMISGCAATYEAVPVGPNRYQVSAIASPLRGGIAGAQTMAEKAASKRCASLGRQLNVLNVETGHEYPAAGSAIITFECI